jgi:molybdenum cofactor guanylyltransferase
MGIDKALLKVDGRKLLVEQLVETLAGCCHEVLLVGGDPSRFEGLGLPARWVPDSQLDVGPLGGILGALEACIYEACLVVACDMPFVIAEVVRALAEGARDTPVLAFPAEHGLEPLLAVYSKDCIGPLQEAIDCGELAARAFLGRVGARGLTKAAAARADPRGEAPTNLNTPEDLARLSAGHSESTRGPTLV